MGKARYTPEEYATANAQAVEICERARNEGRHGPNYDFCYDCGLPQFSLMHVTLEGKYVCQWCAYSKHNQTDLAMMTDDLERMGGTFTEDGEGVWRCNVTIGRVSQLWILNTDKSLWERIESTSSDAQSKSVTE